MLTLVTIFASITIVTDLVMTGQYFQNKVQDEIKKYIHLNRKTYIFSTRENTIEIGF